MTLQIYRGILLILKFFSFILIPLVRSILREPEGLNTLGVGLRCFCEDMGVTFIKLGQYLATRFDIIPGEICRELNQLFERVPAMPFDIVSRRIQEELGKSPEQVFRQFFEKPVGSASIAQVHKAITFDDDVVAVKVQRPHVREIFQADIRNIRIFAKLAEGLHILGNISIVEIVDEFAAYTLQEMDYISEGKVAESLRSSISNLAYVPRIRWDLSTQGLLTMEFIEGISLLSVFDAYESGQEQAVKELLPKVNLAQVLDCLARACLYQLFVTGLFHADPHPANILIQQNGTVTFVDCGMYGEVALDERLILSKYIESVTLGKINDCLAYLMHLILLTPESDITAFKQSAKHVFRRWYEFSSDPSARPEDRHVGKYQGELLNLMRIHGIHIKRDLLLFWRNIGVLDATALRFPEGFDLHLTMRNFFSEMKPNLSQNMIDEFTDTIYRKNYILLPQSTTRDLGSILNSYRQFVSQVRIRLEPKKQESQEWTIPVQFGTLILFAISLKLLPLPRFLDVAISIGLVAILISLGIRSRRYRS